MGGWYIFLWPLRHLRHTSTSYPSFFSITPKTFLTISSSSIIRYAALALDGRRGAFLIGSDFPFNRGEIHVEGGAHSHLRFHRNVARIVPDNGMDRGQTETAALLFRSKIRIEDLSQVIAGDADSLVRNGYLDIPPLGRGNSSPTTTFSACTVIVPPSGMA